MPVNNTLKLREEYYGESMDTLIPRLLRENKHVVFKVAVVLGVYPETVRYWLTTHGWEFDHELNRWVKVAELTTDSDPAA
jgi:predicted urease superfamily metal-dependent hydrolase